MNKLIRAIVQGWLNAGEDIIVGGQAVIEGVMMRSPNAYAVAVRKKNGEIIFCFILKMPVDSIWLMSKIFRCIITVYRANVQKWLHVRHVFASPFIEHIE